MDGMKSSEMGPILDRIIHNSYDIFIDCDVSMREKYDLKASEM